MTTHDCQDLIKIFNGLFEQNEATILIGGSDEPMYLPADQDNPHSRVIFTRDYFASALHEIAHWCLAGDERRKLVDYGYWYFPEGRTAEQQIMFENAEVKPQALECIFSEAAGSKFIISRDCFSEGHGCAETFTKKIAEQVQQFLQYGLPERAAKFTEALTEFYRPGFKAASSTL